MCVCQKIMLFLTYFSLGGELILFELLQKKVLHFLVFHHRLANHNHFVFSLHEALADVESFSYSAITQVTFFFKFEKTKMKLTWSLKTPTPAWGRTAADRKKISALWQTSKPSSRTWRCSSYRISFLV